MIGLELNDAGILAAAGDGSLLALEENGPASPGIAVIEGGNLQVGLAAEKCCRLLPRQTNHTFWDNLASTPLQDPAFAGWTHADLAYAHLAGIWEKLAAANEALVVAVPDTYASAQMELLAGVLHALSIPIQGFVSLALAALPKEAPAETLLHLELHRHRTVLSVVDNRRATVIQHCTAVDGIGLERLRSAWMQVIADEFVRHTRFDPFHAADTEQTVYDKLPTLLSALAEAEETPLEIATPSASHRIGLTRRQMEASLVPLMDALHRQIRLLQKEFFRSQPLETILVSHQAARLPGFCDRLAAAASARAIPLPEGAAAAGALAFARAFPDREGRKGVPFLNRQPRKDNRPDPDGVVPGPTADTGRPRATHVLYRSRGYPITAKPIVIGRKPPEAERGILVQGRTEGVSRRHCTVLRREGRAVLIDTSTYGTFVDGIKIAGEIELTVGQSIRVGTPGEELQVIACLDNDETPHT